jgi:hypothetical protein
MFIRTSLRPRDSLEEMAKRNIVVNARNRTKNIHL